MPSRTVSKLPNDAGPDTDSGILPDPEASIGPYADGMNEPQRDDPASSVQRVQPRDLRVSDAEREHVVGILETALGQGMLTLDEFTARTDTALAARTRGQLNIVLADLPGLHHRDAAQHQQGAR